MSQMRVEHRAGALGARGDGEASCGCCPWTLHHTRGVAQPGQAVWTPPCSLCSVLRAAPRRPRERGRRLKGKRNLGGGGGERGGAPGGGRRGGRRRGVGARGGGGAGGGGAGRGGGPQGRRGGGEAPGGGGRGGGGGAVSEGSPVLWGSSGGKRGLSQGVREGP